MHKVYNVINSMGDWWLAKMVQDVSPGNCAPGTEGWVPCTFMAPYNDITVGKTLTSTSNFFFKL